MQEEPESDSCGRFGTRCATRSTFSALRVPNAAALFERLRSSSAGVVLGVQSIEGLHDDEAERHRLLNAASTLIAHRLADPDPIVTRAGTTQRAERSHQLDHEGPTGAGSLRIQDTYRIDPNHLRSLPTGIAYVVTAGRAAKVAVSRGGPAPSAAPPDGLRGEGGPSPRAPPNAAGVGKKLSGQGTRPSCAHTWENRGPRNPSFLMSRLLGPQTTE